MNLSTMDPLAFPWALFTLVENYFSTLSIINASGGVISKISLHFLPGIMNVGAGLTPCPETISLYLELNSFYDIGVP